MPESDDLLVAASQSRSPDDAVGGTGRSAQAAHAAAAASDRIVELVGKVKARSTLKVVTVLRAVVYGLVVVVALVTALLFTVLGLVRIWDVYLPLSPVGRRVWLGYVVVGGLVFLSGALLLGRRRAARQ